LGKNYVKEKTQEKLLPSIGKLLTEKNGYIRLIYFHVALPLSAMKKWEQRGMPYGIAIGPIRFGDKSLGYLPPY
jgi:hypothetical protein